MRFIILTVLTILTGCSIKGESESSDEVYTFNGNYGSEIGVVDMKNKTCKLELDINDISDEIPTLGMAIPIYVSKPDNEGKFMNELLDILTRYDEMGASFRIVANDDDDIIIVSEPFDDPNLHNISGIFVSPAGKVFFLTDGSEGIISDYGLQKSEETMKLYVTYNVKQPFINDVSGTYIQLEREETGRIDIEYWYSEAYRPGEKFSGVPISVTEQLTQLYEKNGFSPDFPFLKEPIQGIPSYDYLLCE